MPRLIMVLAALSTFVSAPAHAHVGSELDLLFTKGRLPADARQVLAKPPLGPEYIAVLAEKIFQSSAAKTPLRKARVRELLNSMTIAAARVGERNDPLFKARVRPALAELLGRYFRDPELRNTIAGLMDTLNLWNSTLSWYATRVIVEPGGIKREFRRLALSCPRGDASARRDFSSFLRSRRPIGLEHYALLFACGMQTSGDDARILEYASVVFARTLSSDALVPMPLTRRFDADWVTARYLDALAQRYRTDADDARKVIERAKRRAEYAVADDYEPHHRARFFDLLVTGEFHWLNRASWDGRTSPLPRSGSKRKAIFEVRDGVIHADFSSNSVCTDLLEQ